MPPQIEPDCPARKPQVLELANPLLGVAGERVYENHRQSSPSAIVDGESASRAGESRN
jgi:hypothetical protein